MKVWPVAAILLAASIARAEPVVTVRDNGPVANRINLVIVGDGYAQADMVKYSSDTDNLVRGFFAQQPFAEYASYFNVFRVDVESPESGVSHPESGVTRRTALGAYYNCGGIQRTVCANVSAVNTVLSRSLAPDSRDLVIVLVNDSQYGGSGGSVVVASTAPEVIELALHEMGHTLGLLGDEYSASPPPCNNGVEPSQVNIAKNIARASIKWATWVDGGTPLPTSTSALNVPGAYEGASYCTSGLYRPTFDSKMRSLNRSYDAVNTEQLILRFYNFVQPFDTAVPAEASVSAACGSSVTFGVKPLRTTTRELSVVWRVDGAQVATGPDLVLGTSPLSQGAHTVEADVRDSTTAVRRDPTQALVETQRWTLTVGAPVRSIFGFPESRCATP
ncbi:MAG: M64 family metallopeptidase [Vicinamibacterales bacterium]